MTECVAPLNSRARLMARSDGLAKKWSRDIRYSKSGILSFSGPLHQGHHLGRVALSDYLKLCDALRNFLAVAQG